MQQVVFHANNISVHVCTSCTLACIFILYVHVHKWLVKYTYTQQAWFCQNMSAYKVSYINVHVYVYEIVHVKVFLGHIS